MASSQSVSVPHASLAAATQWARNVAAFPQVTLSTLPEGGGQFAPLYATAISAAAAWLNQSMPLTYNAMTGFADYCDLAIRLARMLIETSMALRTSASSERQTLASQLDALLNELLAGAELRGAESESMRAQADVFLSAVAPLSALYEPAMLQLAQWQVDALSYQIGLPGFTQNFAVAQQFAQSLQGDLPTLRATSSMVAEWRALVTTWSSFASQLRQLVQGVDGLASLQPPEGAWQALDNARIVFPVDTWTALAATAKATLAELNQSQRRITT